MTIFQTEIILYVADQERGRDFYAATLGMAPTLDVPGMTEFSLGGVTLGLMPERGIRKLLGDAFPSATGDVARCELYLTVDDPMAFADRAAENGARELSPLQARDWGDDVVYLSDPDHHIIAFARASR